MVSSCAVDRLRTCTSPARKCLDTTMSPERTRSSSMRRCRKLARMWWFVSW
ncbi:hypothetical protein LINPERPRIM_LOCUS11292 [Linum perenne]